MKIKTFMEKSNECSLQFKWISRNTYGDLDRETDEIRINLTLCMVEVFVHEVLHYIFPDLSETKIKRKTNRMLNRLTLDNFKEIAKHLWKQFYLQGGE